MNTLRFLIGTAAALAIAMPATLAAQQLERDVPVLSEELAVRLEGYSYKEGPESELEFKGTSIALAAEGEAEVEFQEGRARVDVSVEKLPNAAMFGPFTTYVLWAVSADGSANNLGSIEVKDGRGSLEASTSLSQFALIVSAEPHFAVSAPSRAIVLQNLGTNVKATKVNISGLKQRIDYSSLVSQPRDDKIPHDLIQARYALDIAEGAEAGRLASREYSEAEALLARAEAAQKDKKYSVRNTVPQIAREAVQKAEDARLQAVLALAEERRQEAARAARADAEAKAASEAAIAAEAARRSEAMAADSAAQSASSEAEKRARADLTARLNRALPTHMTDRGIVAEIAGVQFATGAATLNSSAREALARFAGIVVTYPSLKFTVEGHTDITGSDETNRKLSYARGITVRDYLIEQGVDAASISVEGLGPSRPVADNSTSEGRARNRRVEIILTGDLVAGT
jgi:outer membrane protein OmpA-like peptidoglycan-associated protein